LAREFLATGANAVVSTSWEVDDEASVLFSGVFYKAVRDGKSYSEAVRDAQLALLNVPVFSQPYYWAPYFLQTVAIRGDGTLAPGQ
jgi:CHAT domain-containing protein